MKLEYNVDDTIYVKGKIKKADERSDKYPYGVVFDNSDIINTWISGQVIVEPPAKPTIPKGVADEIQQAKDMHLNFYMYITKFASDSATCDFALYNCLADVSDEQFKILSDAWYNGYTVEKSKLYNLVFNDDLNGKIACLFKQPILDELWVAYETSDINLKYDENYQFNQEEIDKYNKDFLIKNTDLNDYKVEVPSDD